VGSNNTQSVSSIQQVERGAKRDAIAEQLGDYNTAQYSPRTAKKNAWLNNLISMGMIIDR
jgi:hypothetical protein